MSIALESAPERDRSRDTAEPGSHCQTRPRNGRLHQEAHASPFPMLRAPIRMSHFAIFAGEHGHDDALETLADLCATCGAAPPAVGATFYWACLGAFDLRWEWHAEFASYAFLRRGEFDSPFAATATECVPSGWLREVESEIIAPVHVAIEDASRPVRSLDDLHRVFDGHRLVASHVVDANATIWSAFQIHDDGFGRIYVQDRSLTECRAGRLLQRLGELEIYRLLTLMSRPLAIENAPRIAELDQKLSMITESLAGVEGLAEERVLLRSLSQLAGDIERIRSKISFRFSVSRMYDAMARARLQELREEEIEGFQTFAEFLERRLTPALLACTAVSDRVEDVSRRIDRASDLLRTRIDLALEAQNQELLASMDNRGRQQVLLQQTVEGLSIAAVSYYFLGLVSYALTAASGLGMHINHALAIGVSLPFVIGSVWLSVRAAHRRVERHAAILHHS